MKFKLRLFFIPFLMGLIISCTSAPSGSGSTRSAGTFDLIQNAVFEVVVEKPVEDLITYDRALNWDNVPFAIRNDKYYSIGTAFAISGTELITAFHVINLAFESMVFNKYFIRDSRGEVFEIDRITGGCYEKDYLIFTVKEKTFDMFFQFETNYNIGDPVLSIGNALGEGIVMRNGLVLGTVPEEDSGRWDLLKSSADGNPGNSGGPLVTPDGRVVALVTALRDNILYSTPAQVILDGDRSNLSFRMRLRFGHLLLSNRHENIFETAVPVPDTYAEVIRKLRAAYVINYDQAMTALFNEAPEYLTGPNNAFLLNSSLSSTFPEVSFVDPNDDNWKLSGLNRRSFTLANDGRLFHVQVSGYNFYKIRKPNNISVERANTDPKYIMDLILQNIRTDRTLWGSDRYRILSFGDPAFTSLFKDKLGRTWISADWLIGFDDKVLIMYILPMPDGPVAISTIQNSSFRQDYKWDMEKICDHLFAAYSGAFNLWADYFALERFTPEFFRDIRFQWNSKAPSFSLNSGNIRINAYNSVFDWTDDSELFLAHSWYMGRNQPEFGVRKVIINRDFRGNDYVILYRNIYPDSRLGSGAMENWNDLVHERHPLDGNPTISARDNTGSIGVVLNSGQANTLYSLYLEMENPQNEENLTRRFNALRQGVYITN